MSEPMTIQQLVPAEEVLKVSRPLSLKEIAGVNLNDDHLRYRVRKLHIENSSGQRLFLARPFLVDMTIDEEHYAGIEQRLREQECRFTATWYPPRYNQDQGYWWQVNIEVDCLAISPTTVITVVECGYSVIFSLNGINVDVACTGISGGIGQPWTNDSYGLHLSGGSRLRAFESILARARPRWYHTIETSKEENHA